MDAIGSARAIEWMPKEVRGEGAPLSPCLHAGRRHACARSFQSPMNRLDTQRKHPCEGENGIAKAG